jgi:hypothetical protein
MDLSTASGRLMFRMKMAVSCYMPEDMREVAGIERAKKEGKYRYGRGRPKPRWGVVYHWPGKRNA